MTYDYQDWQFRMSQRQDLTASLAHLTRPSIIDGKGFTAVDVLIKMLSEKRIIGSDPRMAFIRGDDRAVCFQEAPLNSIAQNLAFEKKYGKAKTTRYRYSGCGLIFSKRYLFEEGCRPVIYGKYSEKQDGTPENELYRLVTLDLSDTQKIVDWSHEREWRLRGNFCFELQKTVVLLETKSDYQEFITKCLDDASKTILEGVGGIVLLDALLM